MHGVSVGEAETVGAGVVAAGDVVAGAGVAAEAVTDGCVGAEVAGAVDAEPVAPGAAVQPAITNTTATTNTPRMSDLLNLQ
jgi:hypothetical protein